MCPPYTTLDTYHMHKCMLPNKVPPKIHTFTMCVHPLFLFLSSLCLLFV